MTEIRHPMREEHGHPTLAEGRRQATGTPPNELAYFSFGVLMASIGIVVFLYAVAFTLLSDITDKPRDIFLFVFGGIVLAPLCSYLGIYFLRRPSMLLLSSGIEAVTVWTAISALSLFFFAKLFFGFQGTGNSAWIPMAKTILYGTLLVHFFFICILIIGDKTRRYTLKHPSCFFRNRYFQAVSLFVALSWATMSLFRFESGWQHWNGLAGFLFGSGLAETSPGTLLAVVLASSTLIGSVAGLAILETRIRNNQPLMAKLFARLFLCFLIGAVFVVYFDFSLKLEVLHYLTIVGPAMHMHVGGTPLVDTFSQYGLAPTLLTFLAFKIGPPTLGTAQVMVQIANLLFYVLFLVCLYRISTLKMAALLLGFVAIGLQLATWNFGEGNINVAPSILGLRYFPALLLVLAISLLKSPARHSLLTRFSVFLAALWSIEALVGTLGVYVGFVFVKALHEGKLARGVMDTGLTMLPVSAAVIVTVLATWIYAGALPDYGMYLLFLLTYNPLSEFWTHPASPAFFGWVVPLLTVFLVFSDAGSRTIAAHKKKAETPPLFHMDDTSLFYKAVPLALCILFTSAYFAFRSHDYTLAIALLPTLALLIPASLSTCVVLRQRRGSTRFLMLIPILFGLWLSSYTFLTLNKVEGPYSLALHECRDHSRCTPTALYDALEQRLNAKDVLEPVDNFLSDRWIDLIDPPNLINDAVEIIKRRAPLDSNVTVLLGQSIASELTLLHTGKWQHWPISFGYTDQLIPELAEQIAASTVRLTPGALIIVRAEGGLSPLEQGIWTRLESEWLLCRLDETYSTIDAYRVAGALGCKPID